MNGFENIIYEKKGPLAYITLNRPRVHNAMNVVLRDELFEALRAVADDPEVRVAILSGAGERSFSAGADLTEFGSAPSRVLAREIRWKRDLWGLVLHTPKPTIAVIAGYALGAGVELAMGCDLRICTPDSMFGLPEVALGMVPAAGGSQLLPRTIPPGIALAILMTGERFGAEEAYRLGLVNKIVPREQLMPEAEALAERIVSRGPQAVLAAKQAVARSLNLTLAQGLVVEARLFDRLIATADATEGIHAFVERRPPNFSQP